MKRLSREYEHEYRHIDLLIIYDMIYRWMREIDEVLLEIQFAEFRKQNDSVTCKGTQPEARSFRLYTSSVGHATISVTL